jgi:phytanoyl-CoA hydroxylase
MYIFKNPRIGGEVGAHKDSSFLITDPLSVIGLWISLDEATKDNGCMWGVPGSHVKGPNQFMKLKKNENDELVTYMDPSNDAAEKYDLSGAIPLEVGPGSIVLLHGSFLHYSKPNTSDKQRHAYTLHIVEKNYEYTEDNWIRRSKPERCEGVSFRAIEY